MQSNAANRRVSPGEKLQDFLNSHGLKNTDLAEQLGRSAQYVTDIIKGKKAMDVELALQLQEVLEDGPTAMEWMESAIMYRQASTQPTRLSVLNEHKYAKELVKLKWIDGNLSPADLHTELSQFWSHADKVGNYKLAPTLTQDPIAKQAWSIQVYRLAMARPCGKYHASKLPELIEKLKMLMTEPEDVNKVQGLIEEYGIRFIVLPNPKKCPVDGIASYNEGRPYIGVTLRIARLDSFWFVVMHELDHIKHEDSNLAPDSIDQPVVTDEREVRANHNARAALLSEARYEQFLLDADFSWRAIVHEAQACGVNPSILLGRLKWDHVLDWSQFAREHPGVRDYLTPSPLGI